MNPQAHCTRFESACPDWNLVPSEESKKKGEILTEIEQELWAALDFDAICRVRAEEEAMDQRAFVKALQESDSEKLYLLIWRAVQADIDWRTQKEYARRERAFESEAADREALEMEAAKREWRMR